MDDDLLFAGLPDHHQPTGGEVEQVGNHIDVWARQFVNRWVLLEHQRPSALAELERLIAAVKERQ